MESFSTQPLQSIVPSYLYHQYADDESLQAFVSAFNGLSQTYLDWFNDTPLGLYTSPNISGPLLDWLATSIYGIPRPITGTQSKTQRAGMGMSPMGYRPGMGINQVTVSGTASPVTDDFYKRALTWTLYRGDGKELSAFWLKRRIARFLYGGNGADVDVDTLQNISLAPQMMVPKGGMGMSPMGYRPGMGIMYMEMDKAIYLTITVPTGVAQKIMVQLIESGQLPMPTQINYKFASQDVA